MADRVECAGCGRELDEDPAETDRAPCPTCGSTRRAFQVSANDVAAVGDISVTAKLLPETTQERLGVLALIVGTGVGVGGATSSALIGLASAAAITVVFAIPSTRHLLMTFARRLAGR